MKDINFRIRVVDDKKLLELIDKLITAYTELLDMIPEWHSIEAENKAEEIKELLSQIIEVKK